MSLFQQIVKESLEEIIPNQTIYENYRPDWLYGLELDFYLPNLNLAIEVQGAQHYFWCPDIHPTFEDFEKQKQRDIRKRSILRQNGIKYFLISSKKRNTTVLFYYELKDCVKNFGLKLKYPSSELRIKWKNHIKVLNKIGNNRPKFKVRKNGICPVNKVSSQYSKKYLKINLTKTII